MKPPLLRCARDMSWWRAVIPAFEVKMHPRWMIVLLRVMAHPRFLLRRTTYMYQY
eukprot:m.357942 g.357942  ORF g.357942 m.357942 type:complete len:55 (-) comp28028_c1_seq1:2180-2344(-)